MFCFKCGKKLPDDAMFCSVCGNATKVPTVSNASEMLSADEHNHEQNSVEESKENQKENSKESSNEGNAGNNTGNENGNQTLSKSANEKKSKKEDISSLTGIEKYIYYNRKIGSVLYCIFAVVFLLIAIMQNLLIL